MSWRREGTLKSLRLVLRNGLRCIHLYNAKAFDVEAETSDMQTVLISSVDENGYLGLVIKTPTSEKPMLAGSIQLSASFAFRGEIDQLTETFEIKLFRPLLQVSEMPHKVQVAFTGEGARPQVEPKIRIRNEGKGTAFLVISLDESSEIELHDYFELKNGRNRFLSFISERLDALKKDYHSLIDLIDRMKRFIESLSKMTEQQILDSAEEFLDDLEEASERDPDFADDLQAAFLDAFLAVFALDSKFSAWTQTLESTKSQQIVLLNPWSSLNLPKGESSISLVLRYVDALGQGFPEQVTEDVEIHAKGEGLLPIYELVEVESDHAPNAHKGRRGKKRRRR